MSNAFLRSTVKAIKNQIEYITQKIALSQHLDNKMQ